MVCVYYRRFKFLYFRRLNVTSEWYRFCIWRVNQSHVFLHSNFLATVCLEQWLYTYRFNSLLSETCFSISLILWRKRRWRRCSRVPDHRASSSMRAARLTDNIHIFLSKHTDLYDILRQCSSPLGLCSARLATGIPESAILGLRKISQVKCWRKRAERHVFSSFAVIRRIRFWQPRVNGRSAFLNTWNTLRRRLAVRRRVTKGQVLPRRSAASLHFGARFYRSRIETMCLC